MISALMSTTTHHGEQGTVSIIPIFWQMTLDEVTGGSPHSVTTIVARDGVV